MDVKFFKYTMVVEFINGLKQFHYSNDMVHLTQLGETLMKRSGAQYATITGNNKPF